MIDKAQLSEKTIQRVAQGGVKRKKARKAPTKAPKVEATTLHPLLRRYLKMQGLKVSSPRVKVIHSEEMIIH